jgi:hypothetical protein
MREVLELALEKEVAPVEAVDVGGRSGAHA